jgi:hypothetical protein
MIKEITVNIYKYDLKVFIYPDGDMKLAPLEFVQAVNGKDSIQAKMCLENPNRQPIEIFHAAIYLLEETKKGNMAALNFLLFSAAKGIGAVIIDSIYSGEFGYDD